MTTRSFHHITVNNEDIKLRVFTQDQTQTSTRTPVVLMTSGLLWLGGGFLGILGNLYNDKFGRIFARNGAACVQLHTPNRHLAHTRVVDFVALTLFPLTFFVPYLETFLIYLDILMLYYSHLDLMVAFLAPFLPLYAIHIILRLFQYSQGIIPSPPPRSHHAEVKEAINWIQSNQDLLNSNGQIILCGYSSGAQVAALYALSSEPSLFSHVLLISGVYSLDTSRWGRFKIFGDALFRDVLGLENEQQREMQSPENKVESDRKGQEWVLLSAKSELLGFPAQDVLFKVDGFRKALELKNAKVTRAQCGSNHWTLMFEIESFIKPFFQKMKT